MESTPASYSVYLPEELSLENSLAIAQRAHVDVVYKLDGQPREKRPARYKHRLGVQKLVDLGYDMTFTIVTDDDRFIPNPNFDGLLASCCEHCCLAYPAGPTALASLEYLMTQLAVIDPSADKPQPVPVPPPPSRRSKVILQYASPLHADNHKWVPHTRHTSPMSPRRRRTATLSWTCARRVRLM